MKKYALLLPAILIASIALAQTSACTASHPGVRNTFTLRCTYTKVPPVLAATRAPSAECRHIDAPAARAMHATVRIGST